MPSYCGSCGTHHPVRLLYRLGIIRWWRVGGCSKMRTALFEPGLYYIRQGGFNLGSGAIGCYGHGIWDDAATGTGMVVFNRARGTGYL